MRNLNLLVLRCGDIHRTRAFYELLGFGFVTHRHGTGPEHFASEQPDGMLELYPAERGAIDQTGLGFVVEDLDGLHATLRQRQHSPREIRETELGRMFVVRDPDGRRIEIKASK